MVGKHTIHTEIRQRIKIKIKIKERNKIRMKGKKIDKYYR
jgi:hypothetical protein